MEREAGIKVSPFKIPEIVNLTDKLTADGVDAGVVGIGDCQGELGASVPTFRCRLWVGIVKVDRDHVIRLSVGVSLREEEYSPDQS